MLYLRYVQADSDFVFQVKPMVGDRDEQKSVQLKQCMGQFLYEVGTHIYPSSVGVNEYDLQTR